jgi:hypothetical protein
MIVQIIDQEKGTTQSVWVNKESNQRVVVDGLRMPDGCRELTKEEADAIYQNRLQPDAF